MPSVSGYCLCLPRRTAALAWCLLALTAFAAPPHALGADSGALDPRGCITFVVNVHDWRRPEPSARTVLRLVDIFERHKVRGDFYLTAPVVEAWQQQRPEVVRRLKDSAMTIGYHFRPPHPAYGGFDAHLRGLDDGALAAALRDVETHRLDLATGRIDSSRPGGYAFVAETFGRKPVAASALCKDPRIKSALLDIYRGLGARMTMEYHESGTKPDRPLEYRQGLLIRPSDFSVTRWAGPGEREESFWWNRIAGPDGEAFHPAAYLVRRLSAWRGPRPPLVTALIHENDFYAKGQPGWAAVYFDGEGRQARPRRPPFNLDAPDTVPPRSPEEQEAIWQAYEAMVAAAAARMRVVTSADLVALAKAEESAGLRPTGSSAESSAF